MLCATLTAGNPGVAGAGLSTVVVYGATPSGVVAAIAAARLGASVTILEPSSVIGGMMAAGLGFTDTGQTKYIRSLANEFFRRVGRRYAKPIQYRFEPHVAEAVFREWLQEEGVTVRTRSVLRSVGKAGPVLRFVELQDGSRVPGGAFVDASYEGDLLAAAGVPFVIGREGRATYGESLAGVTRPLRMCIACVRPVDPYGHERTLLDRVLPREDTSPGSADGRVPAYNYRLCVTRDSRNRLPIPAPARVDTDYREVLRRASASLPPEHRVVRRRGKLIITPFFVLGPIEGGKYDLNGGGVGTTDLPGFNWEYAAALPARRSRIEALHREHALQLFHFLRTDPAAPPDIARYFRTLGLCRDEFRETGHWPHRLYVREARRMVGAWVMTQHDLQSWWLRKPDAIAVGSYSIDAKPVRLIPDEHGRDILREGNVWEPVEAYDIPYRILLPAATHATNLLVSVCVSASHIAYSSLRMEPQLMALGESAGRAAAIAGLLGIPAAVVPPERVRIPP